MANAPTVADIGRVYLHQDLRVVLVNDRLAADPTAGEQDYQVAVKPVDPAPGPGGDTFPVALVDYRYLTETDERIAAPGDTEVGDTWVDSDGDDEADMDLSPARPATSTAEMRPAEVMEWADREFKRGDAGGKARLETVRLLREQSYAVLRVPTGRQPAWAEWDPTIVARAEAILDTPVDRLATMVVMSDTVMGNWRTIAATLVPA